MGGTARVGGRFGVSYTPSQWRLAGPPSVAPMADRMWGRADEPGLAPCWSDSLRGQHPEIPCKDYAGMRDRETQEAPTPEAGLEDWWRMR
jgi:hypothetical protein